jgi:hypothetical protein
MGLSERPEHLFVVRLWQEPSRVAPPGQWRGSVEHATPEGEQRAYFVTLEEMNRFMLTYLQTTATESPKAP